MNKQDYDRLAEIVFRLDAEGKPTYPGYHPEVLELPNGDGKVDAQKRYAHVATKYLRNWHNGDGDTLYYAYSDAWHLALDVSKVLQVPDRFRPALHHGALRILEYPVGATSNLHTDFDLFTIMIYRDQPECFISYDTASHKCPPSEQDVRLGEARKLNAQLHIGELGELVGLGPATPHEVIASGKTQHAIVYFAIPDHAAVLPSGQTVGEWLTERMSRSRTYK